MNRSSSVFCLIIIFVIVVLSIYSSFFTFNTYDIEVGFYHDGENKKILLTTKTGLPFKDMLLKEIKKSKRVKSIKLSKFKNYNVFLMKRGVRFKLLGTIFSDSSFDKVYYVDRNKKIFKFANDGVKKIKFILENIN